MGLDLEENDHNKSPAKGPELGIEHAETETNMEKQTQNSFCWDLEMETLQNQVPGLRPKAPEDRISLGINLNGKLLEDPEKGGPRPLSYFQNSSETQEYDLFGEYKTIGKLGAGTFGTVFEVKSRHDETKTFALKVIKPAHHKLANNEVKHLKNFLKLDPDDKSCCIRLVNDYFSTPNDPYYICFPKLGESLFHFKRKGGEFTMRNIKNISKQILTALSFLHENSILHADLKPDNILLLDSDTNGNLLKRDDIRVIDFGGAYNLKQYTNPKFCNPGLQNVIYRAPEVILNQKYGKSIDVWSAGCILFWLYWGYDLLEADTDDVRLGIMERVLGKFSCWAVDSRLTPILVIQKFFDEGGNVIITDPYRRQRVQEQWFPLEDYNEEKSDPGAIQFFKLLRQLLETDGFLRISAKSALFQYESYFSSK